MRCTSSVRSVRALPPFRVCSVHFACALPQERQARQALEQAISPLLGVFGSRPGITLAQTTKAVAYRDTMTRLSMLLEAIPCVRVSRPCLLELFAAVVVADH
jgi:hypothetical protein